MRFILSLALIFSSLFAYSQDIHFSQFYASPLLQNPANAGYFNCDYRFTAIYKSQWKSVTVPYTTFAGSFDMRFVKKKSDSKQIKTTKDFIGVGIVFTNDEAGDAVFTKPDVGLAGAYHKSLDRYGRNYIGGGVMLDYGAGIIDYSKLVFPNQAPAYPGGPLGPSGETSFHNFGYFGASAGVQYSFLLIDKDRHFQDKYFQVGLAAYHINEPQESFITNYNATPRLPIKYVLNSSVQYRLSEKIELFPKINLTFQGSDREYLLGTFARIDLSDQDDYAIYLGSWVRINDAVIGVVRFDVASISFGFSYDINTSPLKTATEGRGGPEFSLIYIGCLNKHSSKVVFCPSF